MLRKTVFKVVCVFNVSNCNVLDTIEELTVFFMNKCVL